jgi:hypothetical protein
MMISEADQELAAALAEPFKLDEVEFKPQSVKGNRALAICYIDARAVEDRLDAVFGVGGWQDSYDVLPCGGVVCRLSVKIGDGWITKADVGSPSDQPDGGDRMKAAFSDAIKRAAVKFGIGRYLYRLPNEWCDYDPVKKQFIGTPRLPAWALPRKSAGKPAAPANTPPAESSEHTHDRLTLAWNTAGTDDRREQIVQEILATAEHLAVEHRKKLRDLISPYWKRTRPPAKAEGAA